MKKISIRTITYVGVTAALIAACSQISIPMPFGVPVTMQTFAIAFAGFFLGAKNGTISVLIYLLLGAVGIPVFSGFKGGLSSLIGLTGGFLLGFLLLAPLCGAAADAKSKPLLIILSTLGILLTHSVGLCQFSLISHTPLLRSFLTISVPFLVKDFMSTFAAFLLAFKLKKITPNKSFS